MIYKKLATVLILILVLCGCSRMSYVERQTGKEQVKYPHIRVQILEANNLDLQCEGTYRLNCITPRQHRQGLLFCRAAECFRNLTGTQNCR